VAEAGTHRQVRVRADHRPGSVRVASAETVAHALAFMWHNFRMEFVTVAEAAKIIGLSGVRLRALIASGELPAEKLGRDWAIRRSAAERFARKDRRGPGRPPKGKTQ
jgi:excisionase family DNA binding protein